MMRIQGKRRWIGWLAAAVVAVGAGCRPEAPWIPIPAGECRIGAGGASRIVSFSAFGLGPCEVTVQEYIRYLNGAGIAPAAPHPQVTGKPGAYRPAPRQARRPVSSVSRAEAETYCQWLSGLLGKQVRLPTSDEWEYAARAGRSNVRYSWGWGSPEGRAGYDATEVSAVGQYAANAFGLHDMGGNVAEWCAGTGEEGQVRGGSWSDRSPESLAVYTVVNVPASYRNADVGFRIQVDMSTPSP